MFTDHRKNDQNPTWSERLTIPIKTPNVADTIRLSLWDETLVGDGELLAFELESFDRVRKEGKPKQRMYHFYGHHGVSLKDAINESRTKGDDEPPRTRYLGKVLIGMQVEPVPDLRARYRKDQNKGPTPEPPKHPDTTDYVLWADIYQACVCRRGNVYVQIEWGAKSLRTQAVPVNASRTSLPIYFFEQLPDLCITEPTDLDQLPMIVVNLMRESWIGCPPLPVPCPPYPPPPPPPGDPPPLAQPPVI